MNPKDLSILDYLNICGDGPGGRLLRWQFASEHGERVEILEEVLADCYSRLVDGRKLDKALGEDQLSKQIVQMLNVAGIAARHDQDVNGHCDVVVEGNIGFMWLGEAKVHSGYKWLDDGFLQLSTRYGTAMYGRDHGELIIYHRQGNSTKVLEVWKARLSVAHPDVEMIEDAVQEKLFFRTSHNCKNSGCKFFIRHTIVPLQHAPEK